MMNKIVSLRGRFNALILSSLVVLTGFQLEELGAQGTKLKPGFHQVKCGFFSPAEFVNSETYLMFSFYGMSGAGLSVRSTGVNIGCRPKITLRTGVGNNKTKYKFFYKEFGLVTRASHHHRYFKDYFDINIYNKKQVKVKSLRRCSNLKDKKFDVRLYYYDAAGRLKSVHKTTPEKCHSNSGKAWNAFTSEFTYLGKAYLPATEKINTEYTKQTDHFKYLLDSQNRIVYRKKEFAGGSEARTYTYDKSGRLVNHSRISKEEGKTRKENWIYKYDQLGRLIHLQIKSPRYLTDIRYYFDDKGNLSRVDLLYSGKLYDSYQMTY